jgi:hypothetical protein
MHTSWKVTAAAAGLLITVTALGTLAVHAQSPSPKPDPSKSSYISVNEEDFATVLARMRAAKAATMKRQMDLLGARYDLGDRPAAGVTMSRGEACPGRCPRPVAGGDDLGCPGQDDPGRDP